MKRQEQQRNFTYSDTGMRRIMQSSREFLSLVHSKGLLLIYLCGSPNRVPGRSFCKTLNEGTKMERNRDGLGKGWFEGPTVVSFSLCNLFVRRCAIFKCIFNSLVSGFPVHSQYSEHKLRRLYLRVSASLPHLVYTHSDIALYDQVN